MKSARFCNRYYNGSRITSTQVLAEVEEWIDAESLSEFRDELSDICYFFGCWVHGKFGLNVPLIGARRTIQKIERRLVVWQTLFESEGLDFSARYLKNGSNHEKEAKVALALALARAEQQAD